MTCTQTFNQLVPDGQWLSVAHYSERRDTLASLQNSRSHQMMNWRIFTFCLPGTSGLKGLKQHSL